MPDQSPAEELRAAAKAIRSDAAWPTEDYSHAVADWLDKIAWSAELDADLINRVGGDEALAVARAYLGAAEPAATEATDA